MESLGRRAYARLEWSKPDVAKQLGKLRGMKRQLRQEATAAGTGAQATIAAKLNGIKKKEEKKVEDWLKKF